MVGNFYAKVGPTKSALRYIFNNLITTKKDDWTLYIVLIENKWSLFTEANELVHVLMEYCIKVDKNTKGYKIVNHFSPVKGKVLTKEFNIPHIEEALEAVHNMLLDWVEP
jgi:hypothetical protein